jgi:hypothetical protein
MVASLPVREPQAENQAVNQEEEHGGSHKQPDFGFGAHRADTASMARRLPSTEACYHLSADVAKQVPGCASG